MKRVATGIAGLDKMLKGGFPPHRLVLVSGQGGSGKTIFGMQFLYQGIMKYGEAGIFVAFDELISGIRDDYTTFGWDLQELEDENLLIFVDGFSSRAGMISNEQYQTEVEIDEFLTTITDLQAEFRIERIVIDSLTSLAVSLPDELVFRREFMKLGTQLNAIGVTSVVTSEMGSQGQVGRFGVEEYIAPGVIVLEYQMIDNFAVRSLIVRKMKGIQHEIVHRPLKIGKNGLTVYPDEDVYL